MDINDVEPEINLLKIQMVEVKTKLILLQAKYEAIHDLIIKMSDYLNITVDKE